MKATLFNTIKKEIVGGKEIEANLVDMTVKQLETLDNVIFDKFEEFTPYLDKLIENIALVRVSKMNEAEKEIALTTEKVASVKAPSKKINKEVKEEITTGDVTKEVETKKAPEKEIKAPTKTKKKATGNKTTLSVNNLTTKHRLILEPNNEYTKEEYEATDLTIIEVDKTHNVILCKTIAEDEDGNAVAIYYRLDETMLNKGTYKPHSKSKEEYKIVLVK